MEKPGGDVTENVEGKEQDGTKDGAGDGTGRETEKEPEREAEETEEEEKIIVPVIPSTFGRTITENEGDIARGLCSTMKVGSPNPPPSSPHVFQPISSTTLINQTSLPRRTIYPAAPRGWKPVRPQRRRERRVAITPPRSLHR